MDAAVLHVAPALAELLRRLGAHPHLCVWVASWGDTISGEELLPVLLDHIAELPDVPAGDSGAA